MPSTELGVYALAAAKQTAKGTPAAAPTKRLIQVGGDFGVAQALGSEDHSDLSKFGTSTDWVDNVTGNGTPALEGDLDAGTAWLLYLYHGAETVTETAVGSGIFDHVFVPQLGPGFFSTWWSRVGLTNVRRHQHNDVRVGAITIEASTAAKAMRVTPSLISLDPGVFLGADPTWPAYPDPLRVFNYVDAEGAFNINGVIVRGHSQFSFTTTEDLQLDFTDSISPFEVRAGNAGANIGATIRADEVGMARFNEMLYGTATPAAGAKPIRTVPALGSYTFTMSRKNQTGTEIGRFILECPGVRWSLPDYPGPNPGGGEPALALAGNLRVNGTNPLYRITVRNTLAAYS